MIDQFKLNEDRFQNNAAKILLLYSVISEDLIFIFSPEVLFKC